MPVSEDDDDRARLGFPPGATFHLLRVSIPARCIVVVASRAGDPVRSDRMYLREYSESSYREVAWPDGCNSWGEPVLPQCTPELFVVGDAWRDIPHPPSRGTPARTSRGGDPVGLYRVKLPSGEVERIQPAHHDPDASDPRSWFLSQVLGVAPDGTRLAVCVSAGSLEAGTTKWQYGVAMLDLPTGGLELCAELPAVFA